MENQNKKPSTGKFKSLLQNNKFLYGIIAVLAVLVIAVSSSSSEEALQQESIISSASAEIESLSAATDHLQNQVREWESKHVDVASVAMEQSSIAESLQQDRDEWEQRAIAAEAQYESLSQAYETTGEPETVAEEADGNSISDGSSGGGRASGKLYGAGIEYENNETKEPETMEDHNSEPEYQNAAIVYWTPNGEVYHYSENCRTLSRSKTIYSGTIEESGKARPCKVCS